jgi:hypothetical protein
VVSQTVDTSGNFTGWAAAGVLGDDHARWIPLLEARDGYNRPRGAAAAMVLNDAGFYGGSWWAGFGVENADLFTDSEGPLAQSLGQVARFMARGVCLRNLQTGERLYQLGGEPVSASVLIDHHGLVTEDVVIRFTMSAPDSTRPPVVVQRAIKMEPASRQAVEAVLTPAAEDAGLYHVTAELLVQGEPTDTMATGFVVEDTDATAAAPELRFEGNYFTLNGRPTFLFGSDT